MVLVATFLSCMSLHAIFVAAILCYQSRQAVLTRPVFVAVTVAIVVLVDVALMLFDTDGAGVLPPGPLQAAVQAAVLIPLVAS